MRRQEIDYAARMIRTACFASILCFVASACGPAPAGTDAGSDTGTDAPGDVGTADGPMGDAPMPIGTSGALCPDAGTTLTWASFGQTFFATYCTRCHASTLVGVTARGGAPPGLNWDDHATVMMNASRIDRVAGAGPAMVNTFMPFDAATGGAAPTEAERRQLAEWLVCGAL